MDVFFFRTEGTFFPVVAFVNFETDNPTFFLEVPWDFFEGDFLAMTFLVSDVALVGVFFFAVAFVTLGVFFAAPVFFVPEMVLLFFLEEEDLEIVVAFPFLGTVFFLEADEDLRGFLTATFRLDRFGAITYPFSDKKCFRDFAPEKIGEKRKK